MIVCWWRSQKLDKESCCLCDLLGFDDKRIMSLTKRRMEIKSWWRNHLSLCCIFSWGKYSQLIYVNRKQCRLKRTFLLHPNGIPNEVWNSMSCVDPTKYKLVEVQDIYDKELWDANVSKSLEWGPSRYLVEHPLKVNIAK